VVVFAALFLSAFGAALWSRLALGVVALYLSQVLLLVVVGELQAHYGLVLHALVFRGWALAAPLLLFAAVWRQLGPTKAPTSPTS
jgi:hypothetical protein